jgi:probable F420-dependent oxidoreductase
MADSSAMRFGIALPNYGPLAGAENLVRLARRAESLGVDSVWVADHLVAPVAVESIYPYDRRPDARPGDMGVIEQFYEPLTTLAYLAGATTRIRLGVSVYVMPYRHPVVTAKVVATLDALSGGRVVFGVGVGWLREEFAALGRDPRRRGRVTDESLEICRRLWRDEVASFEGRELRLPPVRTGPKPVQRPWPPIWIGGNSDAALDRAVRLGDGLHLIDVDPADVASRMLGVRERLRSADRDPASFVVSVRKGIRVQRADGPNDKALYGTPAKIRRDRDAYARAGASYLVSNLRGAETVDDLGRALEEAAEALLA